MRVIAEKTLKQYWETHKDAQGALQAWLDHVHKAHWHTPADVQKDYGADAILPNSRACFNIKGNKYRLVVAIRYSSEIVYIRFIGTHAEYNKIDANTI